MAVKKDEEDKKTSGALAKVAGGTELSTELLGELAEDAGAGTSQNADDNIVPFIVLLQDMSPEQKKRDPEYVQGAEPGMFLNKATKKLYAGSAAQAEETGLPQLMFQSCAFDRAVIEWIPRNDGGGFVARHELRNTPEETMKVLNARQVTHPEDPSKKIWRTEDGKNDLIDTRYHYGNVLEEDGTLSAAVLGFASTGHTASREWMTMMNNFKIPVNGKLVPAPSWSKKYVVGSKPKQNKKGDFFVVNVEDGGIIADKLVRDQGKALHEAFKKGDVRADDADAGGVNGAGGGAADGEMPI